MTNNPKQTSKPKITTLKRDWSSSGQLPYDKIPAFKAAYDCYKECLHRFRSVPSDSKAVARETRQRLMRVMVCIAHARLNIRVMESLQEATDLAIEVQVTIRVLVETHAIRIKDFAIISQYTQSLVRQMVAWSGNEEKKASNTLNSTRNRNSDDSGFPSQSQRQPIQGSLF